MHAEELPESEVLVRSTDVNEIAEALRNALEGSLFAGYRYMVRISEKARSGIVLAPQPYREEEAAEFPKILLPTETARWLQDIEKWHSRYDPSTNQDRIKGWEIRRALSDEGPIAIAWAAWVAAPTPTMPVFM